MPLSPKLVPPLPLVFVCLSAACGSAVDSTAAPAASDDPAPPGSTQSRADERRSKSDIYGADGRREAGDVRRPGLRRAVEATAALVTDDSVATGSDESSLELSDATLAETEDICPEERFADQPVPGFCSGFLVGSDRVVTAGHCVEGASECDSTRVAFGFTAGDEGKAATELSRNDLYACEELLERSYDASGPDYAILELDRPVERREPLALRTDMRPTTDEPVAIVGHPAGLPMKVGTGGRVTGPRGSSGVGYNLDTYGGNSGSPIVDPATGAVRAIHTSGTRDFEWDPSRDCRHSRVCEQVEEVGSCSGNSGTRATAFEQWGSRSQPVRRHPGSEGVVRTPEGNLRTTISVAPHDRKTAVDLVVGGRIDRPAAPVIRVSRPDRDGDVSTSSLELNGSFRRVVSLGTRAAGEAEGDWTIELTGDDLQGVSVDELALHLQPVP